ECLRKVNQALNSQVPAAAARLVGAKKPANAAQVLLAYLLPAQADGVEDDLRMALSAVAVVQGKPEACLVRALEGPDPLRRGAAGEALAGARAKDVLPAVQTLLRDKDPSVRLRVALALVEGKDRSAIPVLIALLEEFSPSKARKVEESLLMVAG